MKRQRRASEPGLKKFTVLFEVYASTSVEVEMPADSTREAIIDKAAPDAHASVCHQCSKDVEISDVGDALEVLDEKGDEIAEDRPTPKAKKVRKC